MFAIRIDSNQPARLCRVSLIQKNVKGAKNANFIWATNEDIADTHADLRP